MSVKTDRQDAIMNLISKKKVANQEELQNLLINAGYDVTQATLSRDLKELRVVKIHDEENGYYYRVANDDEARVAPKTASVTLDCIKSVEFSNQLVVIKTHPGFASVVASLVDHRSLPSVMGTIAGDDTLLLILREGFTKAQVISSLSFIGGIDKRISE
ncbi:MAG: arginine repressor [Bacteroidales bacterium]|nr:arginine repressor [Bacteroidales bacterium]